MYLRVCVRHWVFSLKSETSMWTNVRFRSLIQQNMHWMQHKTYSICIERKIMRILYIVFTVIHVQGLCVVVFMVQKHMYALVIMHKRLLVQSYQSNWILQSSLIWNKVFLPLQNSVICSQPFSQSTIHSMKQWNQISTISSKESCQGTATSNI